MNFLSPIFHKRTLVATTLIATSYVLAQIFILNNNLVMNTLTHRFPLGYKVSLLSQLVVGYFGMFNLNHLILLVATAILIGLNIALLSMAGKKISTNGKAKLSLGGTSLISLASIGCPSCSLSIFALMGSGGGFLGLLFSSVWMQATVVLVLLISIYSSLRSYNNKLCVINDGPKVK